MNKRMDGDNSEVVKSIDTKILFSVPQNHAISAIDCIQRPEAMTKTDLQSNFQPKAAQILKLYKCVVFFSHLFSASTVCSL